jgi:hypothetical protein
MARTGAGVDSQFVEGLIEWNSVAPSSSRERLQSGANAAFSQGEPLMGRVDSSGSLATGPRGRRRPATKFNAPVVLQTDRVRAKTRKPDTTRHQQAIDYEVRTANYAIADRDGSHLMLFDKFKNLAGNAGIATDVATIHYPGP